MPSLLRTGALALMLCAACDVGSPHTGSPGLEPPRATDDAGSPGLDPDGEAAGGAGTVGAPPVSGMTGSDSLPGSAGSGSIADGGGAFATAGAGGPGAVVEDAGLGPDGGGATFSELHEAELIKDCTETVLCHLQRDEQLEADAMAACLEDSAALLDSEQRLQAAFLANVERCQHLVGCDYYDCALLQP